MPSIGCGVGAAAIGPTSAVGIALLVVGSLYLFFDLTVLQTRFERVVLAPNVYEAAIEEFLRESALAGAAVEVAEEIGRAVQKVTGQWEKVALVAPQPGGVGIVSPSPDLHNIELGDRSASFQWLGVSEEPLWRRQLEGIDDTGAIDTAEMMDLVDAQVLIPLRHRGELLGLVLIGARGLSSREERQFLRGLRTHATTALANTFLDAEAQGRVGVTKTLGLANAIQEALMPEERPIRRAEWELRGLFRPVAECGGDLWAWRELPGRKLLLVIADATGHGAGPALLSAVAKGTLDGYALVEGGNCEPEGVLRAMNEAVLRVGQRKFMMTAFALVVDLHNATMRYANAGQNFPFLLRNDKLEALVVRGDQLGAREEPQFESHERPLEEGDKVLLFTDGIVEAGEPVTEPFGERRFRRLVQSLGPVAAIDIPQRILGQVEEFLEGKAIHDDVTLVAFEYLSSEVSPL